MNNGSSNTRNNNNSLTNNTYHHSYQSDINQAQKYMQANTSITTNTTQGNNMPANRRINLSAITQINNQTIASEQQATVMIPKNTYFKIYPDRQIDVSVAHNNGHWYLFDNTIADDLQGQLKKLSQATLYQGITETGQSFILPVVKPWPGYTDSWYRSLSHIADQATDKYLKIECDSSINNYAIVEEKRLTNQVQWPQDDFDEIISTAFPDEYYVNHDRHPLLDELYIG